MYRQAYVAAVNNAPGNNCSSGLPQLCASTYIKFVCVERGFGVFLGSQPTESAYRPNYYAGLYAGSCTNDKALTGSQQKNQDMMSVSFSYDSGNKPSIKTELPDIRL